VTPCLGVGEPTNTAVWLTVMRAVSLQPQHYGDLTFGITLVSITEIVHVKAVYITYAIKYFVGSCSQNSRHDKCCVPSASRDAILIWLGTGKGLFDGPTVMKHNKCYSMGCR